MSEAVALRGATFATDRGSVIATRSLTKRFGATTALDDLTLDVPAGVVFGYLGPNGAGKTTTIRTLMGLLRATSGRAELFGLDAFRDRDRIHARVGYLSGEFAAYPDLTSHEYLRYLANLRGNVEWAHVEFLSSRLELDLRHRIGALSHGNRQKVGLIQAFMHRPELLILDEPTIGLDPLMQHEFVSMVREARNQGATVFLSSHILDEVEAVADVVGILRRGRLVVVEKVDEMKAKALRRLTLTFDGDPPVERVGNAGGVTDVRADGHALHVLVEGSLEELFLVAAPYGIRDVSANEVDLEEIFMAYYDEER